MIGDVMTGNNGEVIRVGIGNIEGGILSEYQKILDECFYYTEYKRKNIKDVVLKELLKALGHASFHCEICGYDDIRALCIHHINRIRGGDNERFTNYRILCCNCHEILHNPIRDKVQFIVHLLSLVNIRVHSLKYEKDIPDDYLSEEEFIGKDVNNTYWCCLCGRNHLEHSFKGKKHKKYEGSDGETWISFYDRRWPLGKSKADEDI